MSVWFLLTAAALLQQPQVELQTLEGAPQMGSLSQLTADGAVITTGEGGATVSAEDLLEIRFPGRKPVLPPRDSIHVTLTDGSHFACKSFALASQRAQPTIEGLEPFDFSSRSLATIRLAPAEGAIAELWSDMQKRDFETDALIIRKGDILDYLTGVIGDIDDKTVKFLIDNDELELPREKVFGLIFYHRTSRNTKSVCGISLTDGGLLLARSVELMDTNLNARLSVGGSLELPLSKIESLDFSNGKVVYLASMEPRDVQYVPYFDITWTYRRNSNLDGGPIRLDGKTYSKGLSIHSRTTLKYRLRGDYRRFRAVMGIDQIVEGRGNVKVVISADDNVLLETTVKGTDKPQTLDLDVSGARDLTILVDFGEDLDIADHLDLADARVTK